MENELSAWPYQLPLSSLSSYSSPAGQKQEGPQEM